MTITEEIDKKAGRSYRSKNIMDALKNAYGLTGTPVNIAEGVKQGMTIPENDSNPSGVISVEGQTGGEPAASGPEPTTEVTLSYTITWKNGEETLATDTVTHGTVPEYTGETPTGTGTFAGWNTDSAAETALAELPAATAATTYYAIFTA